MYWAVMRRACESGRRVFDFGRSKVGTGSYAFKMHWGFEPTPLFYENRLLRLDDVPAINPLNPKYALLIATWKRLPLAIANALGPLIARALAYWHRFLPPGPRHAGSSAPGTQGRHPPRGPRQHRPAPARDTERPAVSSPSAP